MRIQTIVFVIAFGSSMMPWSPIHADLAMNRGGGAVHSSSPPPGPAGRPEPFAGMFPPPLLFGPFQSQHLPRKIMVFPYLQYGYTTPVAPQEYAPPPSPPAARKPIVTEFGDFEPHLVTVTPGQLPSEDSATVTIRRLGDPDEVVVVPRAAEAAR